MVPAATDGGEAMNIQEDRLDKLMEFLDISHLECVDCPAADFCESSTILSCGDNVKAWLLDAKRD